MPSWGWVLIAIGAVVVLGLVCWQAVERRRTRRLRGRFGPEYDRTLDASDSRREAEAELSAREERREKFDIRPLSASARAEYVENWRAVQAQFVDDPAGAVARADGLIQSVMADRGYPVEDFERRAADLSVDHPKIVGEYREGHMLAQRSAAGRGSTEDLRQAMRHYRELFDRLVEPGEDEQDVEMREGARERAAR